MSVKNKLNKPALDLERNDYGQRNLPESHRQEPKLSQQPIESGDASFDSGNVLRVNHQIMETRSAEENKVGGASLAEVAALSHVNTNVKANTREGGFLKESSRKIPTSTMPDLEPLPTQYSKPLGRSRSKKAFH